MPGRRPTIWWNESKGAYFTTLKGKQERLHADRDEAEAAFHRLMLLAGRASTFDKRKATLGETVDAFLVSKEDRKPKTLRSYRYFMQAFVDWFRTRKLEEITPSEIRAWANGQKSKTYVVKGKTRQSKAWESTTKHNAVAHVKMLCRWAREEGYIESNSMYALQNPFAAKIRDRAMTKAGYDTIIDSTMASDDAFRLLMRVLWEGGVRPNEACILEARHLHATRNLLTLEVGEHKTGGKSGKVREIRINEPLMKVLREKARSTPSGPILLNFWGRPWRPGTILQRFNRLRDEGIIPRDLVPYTSRHGYATRAIESGIPLSVVAKLMGHESSQVTEAHYFNPVLDNYAEQMAIVAEGLPKVIEEKGKDLDPAEELAFALAILRKHGLMPDGEKS